MMTPTVIRSVHLAAVYKTLVVIADGHGRAWLQHYATDMNGFSTELLDSFPFTTEAGAIKMFESITADDVGTLAQLEARQDRQRQCAHDALREDYDEVAGVYVSVCERCEAEIYRPDMESIQ